MFADEHVLAFLSLEQPNPYKVLIIPREHAATIYDLTDEQAAHIFQAAVRIARVIRTVSGCEGLNVVQSNGNPRYPAQGSVCHLSPFALLHVSWQKITRTDISSKRPYN